jgi:hypothetical protein
MFHDVDETLRAALIADVPINKNEIDISFDRPTREWSSRLTKPTLNLFLYDVRENEDLKDDTPIISRDGNGRAVKQMPARRIDLAYFITAWAKEADDEHRVLGAVLASLYRQTSIASRHFQGVLQETTYEVLARVTPPDELYNPHDIWGVLDNEHHASLSWVITAPLDVFVPVVGPLVRAKELRFGEPAETFVQIGGIAHRKGDPGSVLAGVKVSIVGTAFEAETDAEGRFSFANVPLGDYVWRIEPAKGKTREQKVVVPSATYNIEV